MVEPGCIPGGLAQGSVPSTLLCLTKGSWESNFPAAHNFHSWKSNRQVTASVAGWDSHLALLAGLSQAVGRGLLLSSAYDSFYPLLNGLHARWVTSDLLGTRCIPRGIETSLSFNVPTHLSHCGQKNPSSSCPNYQPLQ